MVAHRKSIILLIAIAIVFMTLVIFRFALAALFMYGFATFACVITMSQQKLHLDFWGFLKKYSWFYWVATITLILFAVVNYQGDKASEEKYYNCYESALNDTVVSIDYWRKTGNKIELSNGKIYNVYVTPYIGEVENIVRRKRNTIVVNKKANCDTLYFEDSYNYQWQFVICNPKPKTIFEE